MAVEVCVIRCLLDSVSICFKVGVGLLQDVSDGYLVRPHTVLLFSQTAACSFFRHPLRPIPEWVHRYPHRSGRLSNHLILPTYTCYKFTWMENVEMSGCRRWYWMQCTVLTGWRLIDLYWLENMRALLMSMIMKSHHQVGAWQCCLPPLIIIINQGLNVCWSLTLLW